MKHLTIFSLFIAITVTGHAQQHLLNGNFEDTSVIHNMQTHENDTVAHHWTMSIFGSGVTDDSHSGNQAVCIWNWYYYAKGYLNYGDTAFSKSGGLPMAIRPTVLEGYYKFIYGDNDDKIDSAVALIWLTRFNSTTQQRDTIGFGKKKLGPVSDYTAFRVDVEYFSVLQPDTLNILFESSENGFCNPAGMGNCLFFFIDDLSVSDLANGIKEAVKLQPELSVSPNPAFSSIVLEHLLFKENQLVSIYNISGSLVWEQKINASGILQVDVRNLESGVYLIKAGNSVKRFFKN